MSRVTIKDIARMAGVSVTTVSRALNDTSEINETTRNRILKICREQGYRKNLLARSLISSKTNVIGIIQPDISSPFHAALALHIETHARRQGYQVMLCCGKPSSEGIDELFDFLIQQRVDGILLTSSNNYAYELLEKYQPMVPSVLLGMNAPVDSAYRVNSVSTDNYMGGRLAAEYLHRLGHRDVIYLGLRTNSTTHKLRHLGFVDTAKKLGMRVQTLENPASSSTIENGYLLARKLFSSPFDQTAIFAASDMLALGIMQAADEQGIQIPQQLSLLGFDNLDYASLPAIRLTTFAQSPKALAKASVHLLLGVINSEDHSEYTHKLLLPTLVERNTCQMPAE